jgi:RNA polymerase sigma factor (sigma-70 family)
MPLQHHDLKTAIELALESLSSQLSAELVTSIKPILMTNLDRERPQRFIEGDISRIPSYVSRVAEKFQILNTFIHQVQVEGLVEVWEPLIRKMQSWAMRFLVKKGYQDNANTRESAKDCANDAARNLLVAYFPYDTDFEPWARVIVHYACLKFIRSDATQIPVIDESLDVLEDTLVSKDDNPSSPNGIGSSDKESDLLKAISQLSDVRREVIELRYFQGFTLPEIAVRMGKTVRAIYSLHFYALQDLRKILKRFRDNLNE